jgi:EAL domain-containing protein (putative c-di-GMP-specific phosphodiesterase class I)
VYPVDGEAVDDLLRNADSAMYYAKSQGRRNYQFYSKELNEHAVERFEKEIEFRSALKNGELEIYYQPQVDVISRHVVGAEALLRWRKNGVDVMGPHKIIALAEEIGLIYELGTWILKSACIECKKWMDLGHRHIRVAVNLSTRQFRQKNLVTIIENVLEETGLPAKLLELEVTESALMENVDYSVEMMADLGRSGIRWSLDDFGTGYSSLNYLRNFPVNVLKVDQSFVREITINPEDAAIVETIIDLAHRLHLTVIAEGVESEEQLKALSRMNCEQVQGYYFSKPMKAQDFIEYIG